MAGLIENMFKRTPITTEDYHLVTRDADDDGSDSDVEEFSQEEHRARPKKTSCNPKYRCLAITLSLCILVAGVIAVKQVLTQNSNTEVLEVDACREDCHCERVWGHNHRGVACTDRQHTDVPYGLPANVTDLNLSNNNITELEPVAFEHLNKMKVLYLSNNQFSQISQKTLDVLKKLQSHLVAIDLSGNPWDCSCDNVTQAFVEWLFHFHGPLRVEESNKWIALVDGYNTKCAGPEALKGRRLDQLTPHTICPTKH